jgi:hypothetical protein
VRDRPPPRAADFLFCEIINQRQPNNTLPLHIIINRTIMRQPFASILILAIGLANLVFARSDFKYKTLELTKDFWIFALEYQAANADHCLKLEGGKITLMKDIKGERDKPIAGELVAMDGKPRDQLCGKVARVFRIRLLDGFIPACNQKTKRMRQIYLKIEIDGKRDKELRDLNLCDSFKINDLN